MASMSVSGVVSGMDWESMITSTIEAAQEPAMVQVNKRTNLTNKKSLFEEMKVTMQSIQSSLTSLKLPSTYKAKDIEIENMGTGSYKKVLTATVNADAEVNVHTLEVKQLATAQTNRSQSITSSTLKSIMGSLESSKMYINVGGQKIGIDVYNTDSLDSLKSRINTNLKTLSTPVNVTAAVVDNKLIIKSDTTGLGTTTVEGTLTDKYNTSGRNSLSSIITNTDSGATTSIVVDDDTAENLKVTSGGSSYQIHKDFEVVNNEIRWRQYKDTNEIKLGDSVGATYTMAVGDKFVKTVTRGSGDSDTVELNFTPSDTDNLKIAAKEVTTSDEIVGSLAGITLGTTTTTDSNGNEVTTSITAVQETDEENNTFFTVTTTTTTAKYYTHGTDFTYENGKITWLTTATTKTNEPSSYTVSYTQDNSMSYSQPNMRGTSYDDSIDVTTIMARYKEMTGSELGTKTLTDSNGTIRTYIDPEDTSLLNVTYGATTYKYGRDFVIRVKDDGNGYVMSWFVTGDSNSDGSVTVDDSNIAVSTYTDYKNISTLDFQIAPSSGSTYRLTLENEDINVITKTVNSSDTDKSLETIFSGYDISQSEYSSIVISNGSRNYRYGRDFIINDSGEIEWLEQTNIGPASYNVTLADKTVLSYDVKEDSEVGKASVLVGDTKRGLLQFYGSDNNNLESKYLTVEGSALPTTENIAAGKFFRLVTDGSNFHVYVKDDEGNITEPYEYGRDFVIRSQVGYQGTNITWLYGEPSYKRYLPSQYQTGEAAAAIPVVPYTVAYVHTFTGTGSGLEDLGEVLGTTNAGLTLTANDYSNVVITDVSGNPYVYSADGTDENADYTINSNGQIVWLGYDDEEEETKTATRPDTSTEYELIYTSTDGGEEFTLDEALTRSNSDVIALTNASSAPDYDEMVAGTVTITQGSKVFYEHYDFEVGTNDNDEVTIDWKTGTDYEWYYPQPGANSRYTINLVTADGEEKTYSAVRNYIDVLDMRDNGFEIAQGSLTKLTFGETTYDLTDAADDDDTNTTDVETVRDVLGLSVSDWTNGGPEHKVFNFNWTTPLLTSRTDLPGYGDDVEISYDYYANTFTITDDYNDGTGIVDLLGLNSDVTEAQNAIIVLNNTQIEKDLNDIGEAYDNEISNLKGVTLHLKGVGEVSLDIFHDADKAVESIQTYVDNYNSLMTWINTRMTESQVDEDTAATIDSDDFRMRWGLLHGNSLLRNTKSQMRNISAQNFTYSFTKRTSSSEIYGTMANNGLRSSSTFRLRIGSTYSDITIDPTDTLETIAAKINSEDITSDARNLHYDANGQKLEQALLKASVEQDRLVITSNSNDQITISGTSAMNALKMNYTYKGVYQLGIGVNANSTLGSSSNVDLTKAESGELEFNTDTFMAALEDNPDETQELMLMYANQMDTWVKSMITSSNDEYGSPTGSLSREIKNLENQISDIDEYLEKYQERLDRMEENLRTKYAAAEQQISKLSQQASAISAILQQLSNNSSNSSSSSSS